MGFLRLLESIRIPVLNVFFSGITYCGDEIAFMVVAFALFWCVNKRTGYYAFLVGLFGTIGNQWLKIACRIPRPWVLDPDFTSPPARPRRAIHSRPGTRRMPSARSARWHCGQSGNGCAACASR